MAYWLGFLYADGCISDRDPFRKTTSVLLSCVDHDHVLKFRSALNSDYDVGVYKQSDGSISCRTGTCIGSNELAEDLISLGCTPRKSLTLEWPKYIPHPLEHHFVRGYFDGNGCLHFQKLTGYFDVSFVGSKPFISKLQSIWKERCFRNKKINGYYYDCGNFAYVKYAGSHSPMTVLEWMYQNTNDQMRMNRRYVKYLEILEVYPLKGNERKDRFAAFQRSSESQKAKDRCPWKSQSQKAKETSSQVEQIDLHSGQIIKIWDRARDASAFLGKGSSDILRVCRGYRRFAYGYSWKFHRENDSI